MTSNVAGAAGTLLGAHVRGYAEAVRLHLADLGPEVSDDLTDGLEADLAEALADATPATAPGPGDDVALDLAAHFGPAAVYAADLRAAAGLPPAGRPRRRRTGTRASAGAAMAVVRSRWREQWRPVTSTPQWAALRGLGRDLRPVWWVARGWVVGAWLNALFGSETLLLVPTEVSDVVLPLLAVLVSVQWGRRRWLPWTWMPRAVVVVSLFALLLTPTLLDHTRRGVLYGTTGTQYSDTYKQGYDDATQAQYAYDDGGMPGDDGVWVDGMQVSNLFAYDANGDPIKDVQLFDDRGRPVRTITQVGSAQPWAVPDVDGGWYFRPATATDGRERWNVYPLSAVPENGMVFPDDGGALEPQVGVQPEPMPWPFLKAPTAIGSATTDHDAPSDQEKDQPTPQPSGPAEAPTSGTVPPRNGTVLEASPVK